MVHGQGTRTSLVGDVSKVEAPLPRDRLASREAMQAGTAQSGEEGEVGR